MNTELIKFKCERLRSLWQDFCSKHSELYELTCDEYMHLLASEIDQLEETIEQKKALIGFVNGLDELRDELIADLCDSLEIPKQAKLADLIQSLRAAELNNEATQIEKLNLLLLDIVEKIQEQNKKNQIFLNKALHSLGELKSSFTGHKNYSTYSSSGGMNRTSKGY